MRLITSTTLLLIIISSCTSAAFSETLREYTLRTVAISNGILRPNETKISVNDDLAKVGKLLFESKLLSPDNSISCSTCHIDQFGSADGLPNAVGVGGKELGPARMKGGGRIVPRNTLPLWARGELGFNVLFWDGKIDANSQPFISQFGNERPSNDPLIVAVHLPPVEISEMVADIDGLENLQTETITSAEYLYKQIVERVVADEMLGKQLAIALEKEISSLQFMDVAEALAAFIRVNFGLDSTRFHKFIFENEPLSEAEIAGGLIFYGKGGCSNCHNGPFFSDMKFHSIPTPSSGFGKNGFGVDYGRYNVTLDVDDRGKFRTPPLYNVVKTAPYMHSGSISELKVAIIAHQDPLFVFSNFMQSAPQRMNFYDQLKNWVKEPVTDYVLLGEEIDQLIAFLATLNYQSKSHISSE